MLKTLDGALRDFTRVRDDQVNALLRKSLRGNNDEELGKGSAV